jgi:hypothetical protein
VSKAVRVKAHRRSMTSPPFTNYRTDWEQFCSAQPATIAAELESLLAATQGNDDEADQNLAALVERAATDPTAARLVLQRVMPGLLSVAKRRANLAPGTVTEILHDLVANAWIAVCTYPLDRRPRKIAANLVRDIEYNTFTQQSRLRRVATDAVADLPERSAPCYTNPGEDVISVLAAARNTGANPDGLRLLGELAVAGRSVSELAVADLITHAA